MGRKVYQARLPGLGAPDAQPWALPPVPRHHLLMSVFLFCFRLLRSKDRIWPLASSRNKSAFPALSLTQALEPMCTELCAPNLRAAWRSGRVRFSVWSMGSCAARKDVVAVPGKNRTPSLEGEVLLLCKALLVLNLEVKQNKQLDLCPFSPSEKQESFKCLFSVGMVIEASNPNNREAEVGL